VIVAELVPAVIQWNRDPLAVFAKHVVHPERSEKNGVATQPFSSEEAPDEAPS
jgi:hypothetical protein